MLKEVKNILLQTIQLSDLILKSFGIQVYNLDEEVDIEHFTELF